MKFEITDGGPLGLHTVSAAIMLTKEFMKYLPREDGTPKSVIVIGSGSYLEIDLAKYNLPVDEVVSLMEEMGYRAVGSAPAK